MNWRNLFELDLMAAHMAAGCVYLIISILTCCLAELGPAVWAIPAVCLVLLVLDLTGRLSLRGSFPKTMAAFALPVLLGWTEMLYWDGVAFWGDEWRFPEEKACAAALLLLAFYALLRKERGADGLKGAASLLEQGSFLGIAAFLWLMLLIGMVLFMATVGLLFTAIIGALLAQQNSLLDYDGVKGILAGLLVLYLLQCLWYWRGMRLLRRVAPELNVNRLALFVPVWNAVQARRLELQIGLRNFYHD